MKLWASMVLWDALLQKKQIDAVGIISVLKKYKLKGLEVRPYWQENPRLEAQELQVESEKEKVHLTYACGEAILKSSLQDNLKSFEQMKESLVIAKTLKSPLLRVNVDGDADFSLLSDPEWQAGMEEVFHIAQEADIRLVLENPPHRKAGTIAFIDCLLTALPKLFLTFDTGNWMVAGEHPADAAAQFFDRIGYLHLKDIRFLGEGGYLHCQPGIGGLDFHPLIAYIQETGYEGPLVLEFPGGEEPEKRIADVLEYLSE